ncbi:MAG: arginase family protein [Pseudomonadota bacterium]|nr:arginase family protein [Pseudomonadota bacterium]
MVLIDAPSNLGLRPLHPGHIPGAWRAPDALRAAGLERALPFRHIERLARPDYHADAQPGSRIRNGVAIRRFSERLARAVGTALRSRQFPLVIGGDCSVLLGCLYGAGSRGAVGLIHVDGHSDFFHPGNYDSASRLGSAAGMDLALATGRGEPLLARWRGGPLVQDAYVTQIGERDELDPDYAYPDIERTEIRRIPVRKVLNQGIARTVATALAPVNGQRRPLWLHVDCDVLDQSVMPAVDSPGTPGLDFGQLAELIARFLASGRLIGIDVTIFDPDLDPTGAYAAALVACLRRALGSAFS